MNRSQKVLIGALISVGALVAVGLRTEWGNLRTALYGGNYWMLAPFVVIETLSLWTRGMRWRVLLQNQVTGQRLFWITNIGYFVNNVLPWRMGEVARMVLVTRNSSVTGMQAVSTAALERVLDLLIVIAMLLLVLPRVPEDTGFAAIATQTAAVLLLGLMALYMIAGFRVRVVRATGSVFRAINPVLAEAITARIDSFLGHVKAVDARLLCLGLVWTAASWSMSAAAVYVLLIGFAPSAELWAGVLATSILALGLAVPSVPAGVGVWEASIVFALGLCGITSESALVFAVVMHATIFCKMALLGMVGLSREENSLGQLMNAAVVFTKNIANKSTRTS